MSGLDNCVTASYSVLIETKKFDSVTITRSSTRRPLFWLSHNST